MSALFLVRHGQANAAGESYDELTPKGRDQADHLGAFWASRALRFDEVFVGPCRRHVQTYEAVAGPLRRAGLPLPDPVRAPGLDELPTATLAKRLAPTLAQSDARVAGWVRSAATGDAEGHKSLQRLIEHVTRLYVGGDIEAEGLEPFSSFRARVALWLRQEVMSAGRGKTMVAFTSAGPVAAAIGYVLDLSDRKVVDVMGAVRNTSFTELRFDTRRISLLSFNANPHLQGEDLTQL